MYRAGYTYQGIPGRHIYREVYTQGGILGYTPPRVYTQGGILGYTPPGTHTQGGILGYTPPASFSPFHCWLMFPTQVRSKRTVLIIPVFNTFEQKVHILTSRF